MPFRSSTTHIVQNLKYYFICTNSLMVLLFPTLSAHFNLCWVWDWGFYKKGTYGLSGHTEVFSRSMVSKCNKSTNEQASKIKSLPHHKKTFTGIQILNWRKIFKFPRQSHILANRNRNSSLTETEFQNKTNSWN